MRNVFQFVRFSHCAHGIRSIKYWPDKSRQSSNIDCKLKSRSRIQFFFFLQCLRHQIEWIFKGLSHPWIFKRTITKPFYSFQHVKNDGERYIMLKNMFRNAILHNVFVLFCVFKNCLLVWCTDLLNSKLSPAACIKILEEFLEDISVWLYVNLCISNNCALATTRHGSHCSTVYI